MLIIANQVAYFLYSKNRYFLLTSVFILTLSVLFASTFLPVFALEADSSFEPFSTHEIYSLAYKHYTYYIPYEISDSIIHEINLDCVSMSLVIDMQKIKEGDMSIGIPRQMLDVKLFGEQPNMHKPFIVLADGFEVEYEESLTGDLRIMEVSLAAYVNTIEVISPYVVLPSHGSPLVYHICAMPDSEQSLFHSLRPPLKQSNSGISNNDILCKKGLELLFKLSDESPMCVKPESKIKLIERGVGFMMPG